MGKAKTKVYSFNTARKKKGKAAGIKGLSAGTNTLREVDWRHIHIEPGFNPRQQFDEEGIDSLARVIAKEKRIPGVMVARHHKDNGVECFLLRDGERRLRAADLAVKKYGAPENLIAEVKVEDKSTTTTQSLVYAMRSNEGEPLNFMEEAAAFQRMLEAKDGGFTIESIAEAFGRSEQWVRDRLLLNKLPSQAKQACLGGDVSFVAAKKIALLKDTGRMQATFEKVARSSAGRRKKATAKEVDRYAKRQTASRRRTLDVGAVDNAYYWAEKSKGDAKTESDQRYYQGISDALCFVAGEADLEGYDPDTDWSQDEPAPARKRKPKVKDENPKPVKDESGSEGEYEDW